MKRLLLARNQSFTCMVAAVMSALVSLSSIQVRAAATPSSPQPFDNTGARRHLIVCVDGVGFDTIEKMRAEGKFSFTSPPSRMIAPFPTLTNISMSEIMKPAGAHLTNGYEDSYFDSEQNRVRGGILDRFNQRRFVRGTFRELFDYHPLALKSGLGYAAPPISTYLEALSDIVRLNQKFDSSRASVFIAYIGSTDSLAHLGGERLMKSFLARLNNTLSEIKRQHGDDLDITIFSDHGNDFRSYRRADFGSALGKSGWRVENRLRNERSVVLPQFGLIGCAVLFTKEANEARLADSLKRIRGVDFAVYEADGIAYVIGGKGSAIIEKSGARFRYRVTSGDPLGMITVINDLQRNGKVDNEGFISDADWFAATMNSARPDAVRRIYHGATSQVLSRANVIVNLDDGFYSGSRTLDLFAFLQATHGNLSKAQSYGFLMSSRGELPTHVSAENVWNIIGSPKPDRTNRGGLVVKHL